VNVRRHSSTYLCRRLIGIAAIALLCVAVTGCSHRTTKLQELAVSTGDGAGQSREYAGVSAEEATDAARKVLRLSGYPVFPTPDGAIAALDSTEFREPVGFWRITVTVRQNHVVIDADLRTHYGGKVFEPSAPVYRLFFERVEYLLKLRPEWVTCAEAAKKWGGVRALCFPTKGSSLGVRKDVIVEPDPDKRLPHTMPTPAQWLALTTRHYPGITPDQVLAAGKEALSRSKSEFEYRDFPGGFVARVTRYRMFFIVFAMGDAYVTHFWELRAREEAGGTLTSIYLTTESHSSGATAIGAADVDEMPGFPVQAGAGAGVYDLFWARLENTLGLSSHWPTCKEARKKGWRWGLDTICF
jgi:hypothetical protein